MSLQDATSTRLPFVKEICKYLVPNPNLPNQQRFIAETFAEVAEEMLDTIDKDSPELTTGFRKLLEAKDCFVRASLDI